MATDDPSNLPKPAARRLPAPKGPEDGQLERRFTESQLDTLVTGGVQIASDVVGIAQGVVEIVKIRAAGETAVAEIDAKTRQLAVLMKGQVEKAKVKRDEIGLQSDAVVQLVAQLSAVLREIPDEDQETRQGALLMVAELAKTVFKS